MAFYLTIWQASDIVKYIRDPYDLLIFSKATVTTRKIVARHLIELCPYNEVSHAYDQVTKNGFDRLGFGELCNVIMCIVIQDNARLQNAAAIPYLMIPVVRCVREVFEQYWKLKFPWHKYVDKYWEVRRKCLALGADVYLSYVLEAHANESLADSLSKANSALMFINDRADYQSVFIERTSELKERDYCDGALAGAQQFYDYLLAIHDGDEQLL